MELGLVALGLGIGWLIMAAGSYPYEPKVEYEDTVFAAIFRHGGKLHCAACGSLNTVKESGFAEPDPLFECEACSQEECIPYRCDMHYFYWCFADHK